MGALKGKRRSGASTTGGAKGPGSGGSGSPTAGSGGPGDSDCPSRDPPVPPAAPADPVGSPQLRQSSVPAGPAPVAATGTAGTTLGLPGPTAGPTYLADSFMHHTALQAAVGSPPSPHSPPHRGTKRDRAPMSVSAAVRAGDRPGVEPANSASVAQPPSPSPAHLSHHHHHQPHWTQQQQSLQLWQQQQQYAAHTGMFMGSGAFGPSSVLHHGHMSYNHMLPFSFPGPTPGYSPNAALYWTSPAGPSAVYDGYPHLGAAPSGSGPASVPGMCTGPLAVPVGSGYDVYFDVSQWGNLNAYQPSGYYPPSAIAGYYGGGGAMGGMGASAAVQVGSASAGVNHYDACGPATAPQAPPLATPQHPHAPAIATMAAVAGSMKLASSVGAANTNASSSGGGGANGGGFKLSGPQALAHHREFPPLAAQAPASGSWAPSLAPGLVPTVGFGSGTGAPLGVGEGRLGGSAGGHVGPALRLALPVETTCGPSGGHGANGPMLPTQTLACSTATPTTSASDSTGTCGGAVGVAPMAGTPQAASQAMAMMASGGHGAGDANGSFHHVAAASGPAQGVAPGSNMEVLMAAIDPSGLGQPVYGSGASAPWGYTGSAPAASASLLTTASLSMPVPPALPALPLPSSGTPAGRGPAIPQAHGVAAPTAAYASSYLQAADTARASGGSHGTGAAATAPAGSSGCAPLAGFAAGGGGHHWGAAAGTACAAGSGTGNGDVTREDCGRASESGGVGADLGPGDASAFTSGCSGNGYVGPAEGCESASPLKKPRRDHERL